MSFGILCVRLYRCFKLLVKSDGAAVREVHWIFLNGTRGS